MEFSRLVWGAIVWLAWDSSLIRILCACSGATTGPICEKWVRCSTSEFAAFRPFPWLQGKPGIWSMKVTVGHLHMTEENRIPRSLHGDLWRTKAMAWISQFEKITRNSRVRFWFHEHHEGMFWLYFTLFPHVPREIWKELPWVHFLGPILSLPRVHLPEGRSNLALGEYPLLQPNKNILSRKYEVRGNLKDKEGPH